jgi:hypothetical protein
MDEVQVGAGAAPASGGSVAAAPDQPADAAPAAVSRYAAFYGLGLAAQVIVWSLIFLGLAIVIATGGHLTEFRYVGF